MIHMYKSLCVNWFNSFIESLPEDAFLQRKDESVQSSIDWLDDDYLSFIKQWETSADQPSRVCAIFMKEVELYLRCLYGTKTGNFWMIGKVGL